VFDEKSALINTAGDSDLLKEALLLFKETAAGYVKEIVAAVETGSIERLGIEAHTLKGGAKTIGAEALGEIAESIERAAKEKNPDAFKWWRIFRMLQLLFLLILSKLVIYHLLIITEKKLLKLLPIVSGSMSSLFTTISPFLSYKDVDIGNMCCPGVI
jgi:HPt (histidine-containing phosphotransfer) domain-containing protein